MSKQPSVLRTALFAVAAASLALFALTVVATVHFNGNPASVRIGLKTVLGLASVLLPGPLLLAVCGWQSRHLFARVVGCVVALPALAACSYAAWVTVTQLRPLVGWGAYDAAAAEAEASALSLIKLNTARTLDARAVRERWKQQPTSKEELADMARRVRAAVDGRRDGSASLLSLPGVVAAPFRSRGVSERRGAMFARLYLGRLDLDGVRAEEAGFASSTEPFARRLDLLVRHHGEWQWIDAESVVFDDADVAKEYDALLQKASPVPR